MKQVCFPKCVAGVRVAIASVNRVHGHGKGFLTRMPAANEFELRGRRPEILEFTMVYFSNNFSTK